MIRRPPRSTQSRSSAASDVYKRQLVDARQAPGLVRVAHAQRQALDLVDDVERVRLAGISHHFGQAVRAGVVRLTQVDTDADRPLHCFLHTFHISISSRNMASMSSSRKTDAASQDSNEHSYSDLNTHSPKARRSWARNSGLILEQFSA